VHVFGKCPDCYISWVRSAQKSLQICPCHCKMMTFYKRFHLLLISVIYCLIINLDLNVAFLCSVSFTHSQSRVTLLHPFINCVSQNPHWWHTFSNLTPKPAKLHTNSRPSTRFFLISQNTFLRNTHTNLKWKYDVLFQTQPIKTPVIHQSLSHTHVQTLFTENHTLMALEKAYKRSKVELFFGL